MDFSDSSSDSDDDWTNGLVVHKEKMLAGVGFKS
jgi:hypothetical protein